ncbi:hypothetical protein MKW98_012296 [Papaver atlanticum]|uniref:Cyclin N-terminal domain-containing protein n=1 Tax=Papaver atlanticum TaxID=357466 RepID=A0AAD4T1Q4_9MAGN|nr:hypothetical protein MKW98_012296 [Papaver atlanticum]
MQEEFDSSFLSLSNLIRKENEDTCFVDDDDEEEEIKVEVDLLIHINNYKFLESEDEEYIKMLIKRENDYKNHDFLPFVTQDWLKCARLDAIKWILKTRDFFGFTLQTAYLSLTYFDRFLSKRPIDVSISVLPISTAPLPHSVLRNLIRTLLFLQGKKFWAVKLLSIACLSLAAKMEECKVPTLLEFQINEKDYCFESKTIQRMELLVLNSLEWRMDPITPFVYLHYFIFKFSGNGDEYGELPRDLLSQISKFIFALVKGMNIMDHPPSSIAAAAVLAALNKNLSRPMLDLKLNSTTLFGSSNNEHVIFCYNAMKVMEIEQSIAQKFEISPDLTSIYSSTSTGVLEDSCLVSAASRTKKRKYTLADYDQNCGFISEKRFH